MGETERANGWHAQLRPAPWGGGSRGSQRLCTCRCTMHQMHIHAGVTRRRPSSSQVATDAFVVQYATNSGCGGCWPGTLSSDGCASVTSAGVPLEPCIWDLPQESRAIPESEGRPSSTDAEPSNTMGYGEGTWDTPTALHVPLVLATVWCQPGSPSTDRVLPHRLCPQCMKVHP